MKPLNNEYRGRNGTRALKKQRVLLIGPPPFLEGGSRVSFEIMWQYFRNFPHLSIERFDLPVHHPLYHESGALGSLSHSRTLIGLVRAVRRVPSVDRVVLFGTSDFCFSYGLAFLLFAKLFRKRCAVRMTGGRAVFRTVRLPASVRTACIAVFRAVDTLLVETETARADLPAKLRRKTTVVRGFRPRPSDSPRIRCGEGGIRFAFVSGLDRQGETKPLKGLDVLLDAFDHVYDSGVTERVELHVYGPIVTGLTGRAQRTLGVVVHGPMPHDRLCAALWQHDVLAFPSRNAVEGHSGVIIEGFMAGLPVIASDLPGPLEIVKHEVNGLVVPTGDAGAFAAAMNRLANDHELRRRLAAGARASASNFDQENVLPELAAALGLLPAAATSNGVRPCESLRGSGQASGQAMRVLHVVTGLSPDDGGPATSVQGLTSALVQEGIHCEIFTIHRQRFGAGAIPPPHVPIHQFEAGFLARFWNAYSKRLAQTIWDRIESDAFDLIHVHEPWHYPGFVAFRAARTHDVPYVLSPRGALEAWCLKHKALKKSVYMKMIQGHILQSADAIHALTNEEMKRISELGYKTPVFVGPNGIDPAPFECLPDASEFLTAHPKLSGKRVILYMGRLHPKKGLNVLARSYASLFHQFKDVALLVVGWDEVGTRKRMEATLKASSALDGTVFTGTLTGKDKLAALACADLFVLSSHAEGFSMAILETLAAGLPVVISKQCHFPEVSEYDAGFVVEPNDESVTEAIRTLLSDGKLRARMGQNGRKLVRERYSWQSVAASMADFYRTLVAARRSSTRE